MKSSVEEDESAAVSDRTRKLHVSANNLQKVNWVVIENLFKGVVASWQKIMPKDGINSVWKMLQFVET